MTDEELFSLLQKYKENRLTTEELLHLRGWMNESSGNRLFMENFIKLYKLDNQIRAARQVDIEGAWTALCHRRRRRRLHRVAYKFTVAACLFLVFGLGLYWAARLQPSDSGKVAEVPVDEASQGTTLTLGNGETVRLTDSVFVVDEQMMALAVQKGTADRAEDSEKLNRVEVPEGKVLSLFLPDGTKVWIHSSSRLSFPSSFVGKRIVELQGEAYFDVAKTGQPFEVHAGGMKVSVLGTQFNVSVRSEQASQVTLVKGLVEVSNRQTKVKLAPGQQAEMQSDDSAITVHQVNTSYYTAWATGVFDFEDMPLEEIVTLLSRWYGVEVEVASPLRTLRLSGTFMRKDSWEHTLEMLRRVSHAQVSEVNGRVILQ